MSSLRYGRDAKLGGIDGFPVRVGRFFRFWRSRYLTHPEVAGYFALGEPVENQVAANQD